VSGPRNTVLVGDVRERLAELPAASVDCVITSPPYFQLRDYGARGQIGLEANVGGWVDAATEQIINLFIAMPGLVVALMITSVAGASLLNLVLVLGAVSWPPGS